MPLKISGEVYKGIEPHLPSLWRTKDQPMNRNTICHIEIEKRRNVFLGALPD